MTTTPINPQFSVPSVRRDLARVRTHPTGGVMDGTEVRVSGQLSILLSGDARTVREATVHTYDVQVYDPTHDFDGWTRFSVSPEALPRLVAALQEAQGEAVHIEHGADQ